MDLFCYFQVNQLYAFNFLISNTRKRSGKTQLLFKGCLLSILGLYPSIGLWQCHMKNSFWPWLLSTPVGPFCQLTVPGSNLCLHFRPITDMFILLHLACMWSPSSCAFSNLCTCGNAHGAFSFFLIGKAPC